MKAESILIQRPERQRPTQRALFALLTLLAWGLWLSLWLPLITLGAWLAGLRVGYLELARSRHGADGWKEIVFLLALAAACGAVAALWSGYNYLRFRGVRRRRQERRVEREEMAGALGVEEATARQLGQARRTVLAFAEDGRIVAVPQLRPGSVPARHGP
jgi:biofilm PGA synthesis protein PgaD